MIGSLTAAAIPYVAAAALAGGLALGWYGGYRWQAGEVATARAETADLKRQVQRAADRADDRAAAAQRRIDEIAADAERDAAAAKEAYDETIREIRRTASAERVCLSTPVVRLLQRAPDRRDAPRPDPGVAPDPGPGPTADPGGPAASELAISEWIAAVTRQYVGVRDRHRDLAAAVRTLPCVTVGHGPVE